MLTLSIAGKSAQDSAAAIQEALADCEDDELKVLIDGPAQAEEGRKLLESLGFSNIVPEDDDGLLFLTASKAPQHEDAPEPPKPAPKPPAEILTGTTGVIISCSTQRCKSAFMTRLLGSFVKAKTKPDVLALLDSAVKFAAYDSPSCDCLKKLEAEGVQVLVSESCSDRLGITESLGAGLTEEISGILERIFVCEKVISL